MVLSLRCLQLREFICIQKRWQTNKALLSSINGNVLFSFPKLHLKRMLWYWFCLLFVITAIKTHVKTLSIHNHKHTTCSTLKTIFFTSYKAAGGGITGCISFQSHTAMFSAVLTCANKNSFKRANIIDCCPNMKLNDIVADLCK